MTKRKTPEEIAKSKQIRESKALPNKSQLTRYRDALKHANAVNRTLDNVNVRKDAEIFELKEALAYVEARLSTAHKGIVSLRQENDNVHTNCKKLRRELDQQMSRVIGLVDHIIAKPELLKDAAPSSEWLKHSPIAYTTDGELRKAV